VIQYGDGPPLYGHSNSWISWCHIYWWLIMALWHRDWPVRALWNDQGTCRCAALRLPRVARPHKGTALVKMRKGGGDFW
jgi:hypothetical protein